MFVGTLFTLFVVPSVYSLFNEYSGGRVLAKMASGFVIALISVLITGGLGFLVFKLFMKL